MGYSLLGRVLDGRGEPIDGKGPLSLNGEDLLNEVLYSSPTHPLEREMVEEPLDLGIRSINGLLTCGKVSASGLWPARRG